jgi:hypothetical protein
MNRIHERGLSRDPLRPSVPSVDHHRPICAVRGGPLAHRSNITEGDTRVKNDRCRGPCRSGGHHLRRHGTLPASGGPVFTDDANHVPAYPTDLTDHLVGREVA